MQALTAIPPLRARRLPSPVSRFARDERASAAIELGIGAVVVLTVAVLAFDLYSLTRAYAASGRIAATMADYVSRETALDGDAIAALGQFLHEQELTGPSALVYVISAVRQPAGDEAAVALWDDDTIRFGTEATTAGLAQECRQRGQAGWREALLGGGEDGLALTANDVVIVVEVCARLLLQGTISSRVFAGNIYRLHALPARDMQSLPSAPAYAPTGDGEDAVESLSIGGARPARLA